MHLLPRAEPSASKGTRSERRERSHQPHVNNPRAEFTKSAHRNPMGAGISGICHCLETRREPERRAELSDG